MEEIEKEKLKAQIQLGEKNIKDLIRENIFMREELEKRKLTST